MAKAKKTSSAKSSAVDTNPLPEGKPRLKVFVATKQTQGQRRSDFCWAIEGEIVRVGFACDDLSVDGPCGCKRSLVGLRSGKSTTTFMVVEQELSRTQLLDLFRTSYQETGWLELRTADDTEQEVQQLLTMAKSFPVGAVVELRGDVLQQR